MSAFLAIGRVGRHSESWCITWLGLGVRVRLRLRLRLGLRASVRVRLRVIGLGSGLGRELVYHWAQVAVADAKRR